MSRRYVVFAMLICCACGTLASAQTEERAVEDMVAAAFDAISARDSEALGALILDGAVFTLDMPYDLLVLDKQGLLAGPQGIGSAPEAPITFDLSDVDILGQVALCRGTVAMVGVPDEASLTLGALRVPEGWRLIFGAIVTPPVPGTEPEVDIGMRERAELIMRGDINGMQAGAKFTGAPSIFVLGLPGAPMVLSGRLAITQAVSTWQPPEEVEVIGEPSLRVAGRSAILMFDSSLLTGAARLELRNVVCLVPQFGEWRVVGFIAGAKSMEPLTPPPV